MVDFNKFLKQELNTQQRQAVLIKNGSILVVAGAGSGKTRVITSRIINLIVNEKANPNSIVALTFTNKAAGEMKERIFKYLDASETLPFIGTFHSYCLLILRKNPHLAPFDNFTILDDDDQKTILRKIIKRFGLEKQTNVAQALGQISNLKNKLVFSPEEKHFEKPFLQDIYSAYETERRAAHSLDFDDLLIEALKLFSNNPEFRKLFQNKLKHILVDEYQDTNKVQHELLKYLALDEKQKLSLESICAVGDEDQSIYSWRGAVVENMLKFSTDFKPTKKIKLEQNYRSAQPILDAANTIITRNVKRNEKNLWSERKGKNRILSVVNKSEYQEADILSMFIEAMPKAMRNSVAILYRTHFQSRVIEEALTARGIQYKIIGGIQFYQRKEIKDILCYLRLISNPFDHVSFFRIINSPTRGIGAKFENLIAEHWNQNKEMRFIDLVKKLIKEEPEGLTAKRKNALEEFADIFYGLDKYKKTSFLIKTILNKTDYIGYLRNFYDDREADAKIENLRELQQSISFYENNNEQGEDRSLENFLHEISLMQEKAEEEDDTNPVLLMTLHAAKGLEFDTVIISGLEEGLFPSSRSLTNNDALEEERRLFYVGITRARERLLLSYAITRNTYGQINEQITSRFFEEVPVKLSQELNAYLMSPVQSKQMLHQWLGRRHQEKEITFFGASSFQPTEKSISNGKLKTEINKLYGTIRQKLKNPWKKNRTVFHQKFGVGVIKKVEKHDEQSYFVTALFKSGEKKLLSSYLKPI